MRPSVRACQAGETNVHAEADSLWLYVRTESGIEGWANSTWIRI